METKTTPITDGCPKRIGNPYFHKDGRNRSWEEVKMYFDRPQPSPPPPKVKK
jgi:hypothetical protein